MLHTLSDRDPITLATPARPRSGEGDLLQALLTLQTLANEPAPSLDAAPPLRQRVPAGATLMHEGAAVRQICVVHAGTFKTVKTGDDGYEHVLGFALRGDLLGYDGLASGRHATAAVALEDSAVYALPLRQFDSLRHTNAEFDRALQATLSRQISRAIELAELMSAVAADARLARFLLHVSARMAEQGLSPRRLRLRMNRREIASHLGVAHETVSRSFGLLADRGHVRVANREVEIVDMEGLRAHAHCTRGPAEEAARVAASARQPAGRHSSLETCASSLAAAAA
jgi:CRP/FNR family transcriptional regulator